MPSVGAGVQQDPGRTNRPNNQIMKYRGAPGCAGVVWRLTSNSLWYDHYNECKPTD